MYTTDSPVDLRFFTWAAPIVQDIQERRKIEWLDARSFSGSYRGMLRGFINDGGDNIAEAIVRVTLDSGWEHEVLLVDLMNAQVKCGYARR